MTESKRRANLTPEQYRVCRLGGTEAPFTGKYYRHRETGDYCCVACGQKLFSSQTKYESGSGWPSFWAAIEKQQVREREDLTHGMRRIEVLCSGCDAHLGHVFPDGPNPTGQRYCINSVALDFKKAAEAEKKKQ